MYEIKDDKQNESYNSPNLKNKKYVDEKLK